MLKRGGFEDSRRSVLRLQTVVDVADALGRAERGQRYLGRDSLAQLPQMMCGEAIEQLGMSHQDNLQFAVPCTDGVGQQAKILEGFVAQILRFIDYDRGATALWPICNRALERLNQFELAAFVGCNAQLRQNDAQYFLEAELRVRHARELKIWKPAREDRFQQRCLAGSGFPQHQHESALIGEQTPLQRREACAMRRAEVHGRRRRCEAKRWSIEPEMPVVHRLLHPLA